jgi:hypothetical protein
MTIDELGSLGELIAAIATLGTLIYLALQIRQNSESVRISASQAILASLNEALQSASSSSDSARVLVLGQTDFNKLPEDEQAQFMVWIFSWMRVLEQAHFYHSKGYLDEDVWEGQVAHLRQILGGTAVQNWWEFRKMFFNQNFRRFVESLGTDSSDIQQPRGVVEAMSSKPGGTI